MEVRPNRREVSSGSGFVPSHDRRRALGRGHQPAGGEQIDCPRVGPCRERKHPDRGLGFGPLAENEDVGERVDVLDPHAGTVGDDLPPLARRAEILVRRGDDPEVLGVLVGDHDEPPRPIRAGRRQVVDGVLPTLMAREHDAGRRGRIVGRDGQPFGGVGAVQGDQHEGPVPGAPGTQREPPVVLLEDQDIVGRVGPEFVTPQLVRTHGFVEADVEDGGGPARPRQSVARVGHHLGGTVRRRRRVERAESELVTLVARGVGAVGQHRVVRADNGGPHGEVLVPLRQDVLVQQYLFLCSRLARRGQFVAACGRAPAMDAVVLALLGAPVVPPRPAPGRNGHVGFEDAGLHLLEEGGAEAVEGGEHARRCRRSRPPGTP